MSLFLVSGGPSVIGAGGGASVGGGLGGTGATVADSRGQHTFGWI